MIENFDFLGYCVYEQDAWEAIKEQLLFRVERTVQRKTWDDGETLYICPTCGEGVSTAQTFEYCRKYHHFCSECGQRLRWEVEE